MPAASASPYWTPFRGRVAALVIYALTVLVLLLTLGLPGTVAGPPLIILTAPIGLLFVPVGLLVPFSGTGFLLVSMSIFATGATINGSVFYFLVARPRRT